MTEMQKINDEIFAKLESATESIVAAVAINAYTRSLMYHKFTGRPKRGIMRRIMPSQELHPLEYWYKLGIPRRLLECTELDNSSPLYAFVFDGDLFYEIAEIRLDREDYERRVHDRRVGKYEWRSRDSHARNMRRLEKRHPGPTGEQQEAFAYTVMGEIAAGIAALATRKDC